MILLKPKMYSILFENEECIKRAKGIKRYVVRQMRHEQYRQTFLNNAVTQHDMVRLQSKDHIITTHTYRKRGLSLFEDKRYWPKKNDSVPYGYLNACGEPPTKIRRILPPSGDI